MKYSTFLTLCLAAGLSVVILASALLDSKDRAIEHMDARRDKAALALCESELGPGTLALWTPEGDLVCRPADITAITAAKDTQ